MEKANNSERTKHHHNIPKTTNATSTRTKPKPSLIITTLVIYFGLFAGGIYWLIRIWREPITETGFYQNWFFKGLALFAPSFILILLSSTLIGSIIGYFRGKRQIHHEDRQVKITNPYQYYKELPNNYGIGVASLLANSTLENEKDIIAAILDLCAQKYLHLSKHSDHYVIRLEPNPNKTPLQNESYLLDLIRENRLSEIDYPKWYSYCVADGVNLGLYHPADTAKIKFSTQKPTFPKTRILLIIGVILLVFGFLAIPFLPIPGLGHTLFGLGIIITVASGVILYVGTVASSIKRISKEASESSYKTALEKHLLKTPKGIEELQKLEAFRAFLAQFHTFVDKDPEAVVLWDRYLSYAQVFGLAKELMKTGYAQLIDNAAFRIDNIDDISITNITKS